MGKRTPLDRTEIAIIVMAIAAWWGLVTLLATFTGAGGERPLWLQALLWSIVAASFVKAVIASRREYASSRRERAARRWRELADLFGAIIGEVTIVCRETGERVTFTPAPDLERGGTTRTYDDFLFAARRAGAMVQKTRGAARKWNLPFDDPADEWLNAVLALVRVETEFELEEEGTPRVLSGVITASKQACALLAHQRRGRG